MSDFKKTLEDARYEVSIELYPNGIHYQIYKPACPDKHCWEVYRNAREKNEIEVTVEEEDLDSAMQKLQADIKTLPFSNAEDWQCYMNAVDTVCSVCTYEDGHKCEECMVKKSYDYYKEAKDSE